MSDPAERKMDFVVAGVADMSPNKRYIRWNELIANGSSQYSYKAFDTKNGIEVVWHTINLNEMEESEQSRVAACVNIVRRIQHKYIIEYQSSWFTERNRTLNIITTFLEPLREFIGKVMTLRWRIVKKWAKQILSGLEFLHGSNIVHRNLTCSHIYINGGTSHTNIGDLWMAAILSDDESQPIGLSAAITTAFTAPETSLTSKLDIYSFGMCVLEMITREEPYSECHGSFSKIRRRVESGILPAALKRMNHEGAVSFIRACLQPASSRPSARELLQDSFLLASAEDDDEVVVLPPCEETDKDLDLDLDPQALPAVEHNVFNKAQSCSQFDEASVRNDIFSGVQAFSLECESSESCGLVSSSEDDSESINDKLGKELADFEHGENLFMDKGVHDGRRLDDETQGDEIRPPAGNLTQAEPPSDVISVQSRPISVSGENTNELNLKIVIPSIHTFENKGDKEVEFVFNSLVENYEEVAKEMIDELMLNISVPSLSAQIESLVRDALRVVGVDNRDLSELAEDGAVSSTDLLVKDDQNVDTPLESCASNSNAENMSEQMLPLTISLILNDHVGNDSEDRESVDHQVNPDLKENAEVSVSSEIPTTFAEPEAPVILSVDVDHQSKMDRGDCGDEEFLKELEKIEKEARVAKRAFDQRIQKHKEIQELCSAEIENLKSDFDTKRAEIEKKEEHSHRKRDEELARIALDLEAKLSMYKEKRRQEIGFASYVEREGVL